MISMLKNWKGTVESNGTEYDNINTFISNFKPENMQFSIILRPEQKNTNFAGNTQLPSDIVGEKQYRITVKQYMTKKSEPGFDFMAKWNNDVPMPLCVMTGTKVKETRGMVYMKLHGDIYAERICTCMACGRKLTNPVSQYFGIGPECGSHNYVNPFDSDEELQEAVQAYKKQLQNTTWEGWVIRSAIKEEVVV